MAAPVWVLSVDLQTKTATFQSGMADAAKAAKASFGSIKDDAKSMGDGVSGSTLNVRASLGLLDNTIRGNHAAAMADLVREFQNTQVVMALLPFAAVIGGIGAIASIAIEVAEHIKEWREEQQKLNTEQTRFGTAAQEAFNSLDMKMLQAEKRSDELRNDHLGALHKELELINRADMSELVKTLTSIAKAADAVFGDLQSHWYNFGSGSAGAKKSLEDFQTQYESLIAQGKDSDASKLLSDKVERETGILAAQRAIAKIGGSDYTHTGNASQSDARAAIEGSNKLKALGVGYTEKEVAAQETLVKALQDQVTAEGKIAALKKLEGENAAKQTGNEAAARNAEGAKQAAAARLAIGESQLQGDKATANAALEIQRASIAERLASELGFAAKDRDLKIRANQEELNALNKSGPDYNNQVSALNEKALQIQAEYGRQTAELRARAAVESAQRELQAFETGQRELIAATQEGSAARLAAINVAIKSSEEKGLQETDFYRQLGQQRVETARRAADEEKKLKAEAGREEAEDAARMALLMMQADQEVRAVMLSGKRISAAMSQEIALQDANREFEIKREELAREIQQLDTTSKEYFNKLKAIQDKEKQLTQAHENDVTRIKDQSQKERNAKILAAEQHYTDAIAQGLTQVLMGQKSFASMMISLGNEVASSLIQMAIKHVEANLMTKQSDGAKAARAMFNAGMELPFPANIVAAPAMAAAGYAEVMAFAGGGVVPGNVNYDAVPALLTPGEGVVPRGIMEGLGNVARNGGFDQKPSMTIRAHFAPTVHALDSQGVDRVLTKHAAKFQKHFAAQLRKMNK